MGSQVPLGRGTPAGASCEKPRSGDDGVCRRSRMLGAWSSRSAAVPAGKTLSISSRMSAMRRAGRGRVFRANRVGTRNYPRGRCAVSRRFPSSVAAPSPRPRAGPGVPAVSKLDTERSRVGRVAAQLRDGEKRVVPERNVTVQVELLRDRAHVFRCARPAAGPRPSGRAAATWGSLGPSPGTNAIRARSAITIEMSPNGSTRAVQARYTPRHER